MRTLLIDDTRTAPVTKIARTYDEGIEALQNEGPWDILYLDHDLADPDPHKTGCGIMNFLEANPELKPVKINLVTSNPVGRRQMQVIIDKLYGEKV